MAHKFIKWFTSDAGKKFSYAAASVTSLGIGSAYILPNTIFINYYKDVVHLYKFGIKVKVTKPIMDRFNEALDLLNLPEHERELVKPFTVFGFDMFNAGTLYSKFGGLIGIPSNFTYLDEEIIDKNDIMVLNEPVNWVDDEAQQLLSSLKLSKNAQIYAIAREVLYTKTLKVLFDTLFASSAFIITYGTSRSLNEKYNLYAKPLSLRLCLYSLTVIFGYGLYSFLTDFTQVNYEYNIDKKLCETHPIFIEGGKEFYEKTIQRNIALRSLMGPLGERYYSALGNENFFLRQRRLPLITRKDFYENKLKELSQAVHV